MAIQSSLRLDYVPYPLWRRRLPVPLNWLAPRFLRAFYPVAEDSNPPHSADALARYLARWKLLPYGCGSADAARSMAETEIVVAAVGTSSAPEERGFQIRLPAQWESMEGVLVRFPVLYPPLWATHAQIIEAVSPAAEVTVIVPAPSWANAIHYYLQTREKAQMERVHFLCMPSDDIWIRDYGPFVGYTDQGGRAVVDTRFTPLGSYPQAQDDRTPTLWAMYTGLPLRRYDFETEGGNYWSDGQGTLLVSDELLARHPAMTAAQISQKLKEIFSFDKLIILPRLLQEETGHVDLVCKLVDAQTVLINRPNGTLNDDRLRAAAAILRDETNALGQPYRVIELPFPRPYFNWGLFRIWRSYTNSLTINGRVLVPVFGIGDDTCALDIYRQSMPNFEVIPIDCRIAANGGGGVHCLTKEIPASRE